MLRENHEAGYKKLNHKKVRKQIVKWKCLYFISKAKNTSKVKKNQQRRDNDSEATDLTPLRGSEVEKPENNERNAMLKAIHVGAVINTLYWKNASEKISWFYWAGSQNLLSLQKIY